MNVPLSRISSVLCATWILAITSGCNGLDSQGPKTVTAVSNSAPPLVTTSSNPVIAAAPVAPSASPAPVPAQPVSAALPATNTVPVQIAPPKNLAPEIAEIARLANNGVNDEVMLGFVEKGTNTFKLGPDELIYLSDIGVAPAVITAMQRKSAAPEIAAGTPANPPAAPAPPLPAAPAPTPEAGTIAAPPATNVITPNYVPGSPLAGTPPAPAPQPGQVIVQQPVVVQQPVTVTYFTEALSPYGAWVEVDGYGRCWRPDYAVLGSGWRPYADGGRWIWSDHGWYWMSDYPWGWATFHYGRWHHSGHHGWVWFPDTVWGPSWVCWRQTSSHCGWAPLPPGAYYRDSSWWYHDRHVGIDFGFSLGFSSFTFISWSRFCDNRPHHYYASHSHSSKLYHDSTVINNTIVGNNNTVVFEGVGRQAVARASRTPIPQASVRETAWTTASGGARERMNQGQGGSVLESPRLAAAPPSAPGASPASGRWAPAKGSSSSGPALSSGFTETARPAGISRETGSSSPRSGFDPLNTGGSVYIPATRSTAPSRSTTAPAPAVPPRSIAPTPAASLPGITPNQPAGAGGRRSTPSASAPALAESSTPPPTSPAPISRVTPSAPASSPSTPAQPFNPRPQVGSGSSTDGRFVPGRPIVPERVAGSGLAPRSLPTRTEAPGQPATRSLAPAPTPAPIPSRSLGSSGGSPAGAPSVPSYTPPTAARSFAPAERSGATFRSAPTPASGFSSSPGRSFAPSAPSPAMPPSRSIAGPSSPGPGRSVAPAPAPVRSSPPASSSSGSGSGSGRRERDR